MVLYQMDLGRIIQIYVVQLGMGIFVLFIGLLILKRSRKRLNLIFATFYILTAATAFVNIIYAPLTIQSVVKALHLIAVILFWYAPLFLLIFCMIIYKSEIVITIKRINIMIIFYFLSLLIMVPIAYFLDGITIDETTNWKPVWNLVFSSYAFLIITFCVLIPLIYLLIKTYYSFENDEIKQRWKFFSIGNLPYFLSLYLVIISNYLNNPTFRLIQAIIGLTMFVSAFLLYYGVIRQLKIK